MGLHISQPKKGTEKFPYYWELNHIERRFSNAFFELSFLHPRLPVLLQKQLAEHSTVYVEVTIIQ